MTYDEFIALPDATVADQLVFDALPEETQRAVARVFRWFAEMHQEGGHEQGYAEGHAAAIEEAKLAAAAPLQKAA